MESGLLLQLWHSSEEIVGHQVSQTLSTGKYTSVCWGPGMTFSQLFRMSRERLLVANDAALRGHLTEFKDHDLLQTR